MCRKAEWSYLMSPFSKDETGRSGCFLYFFAVVCLLYQNTHRPLITAKSGLLCAISSLSLYLLKDKIGWGWNDQVDQQFCSSLRGETDVDRHNYFFEGLKPEHQRWAPSRICLPCWRRQMRDLIVYKLSFQRARTQQITLILLNPASCRFFV